MDLIDTKILLQLLRNARQPVSTLARSLRISREVAKYRIKRLQERGVIKGFTTLVDTKVLGYASAALFLSVNQDKKLIEHIKSSSYTAWSGAFVGVWNMGCDIFGKDIAQIQEHFTHLYEKFGDVIVNHQLRIYESKHLFPEKYLGAQGQRKTSTAKPSDIDAIDKRILSLLVGNARIDTTDIAHDVQLTATAVARRIRLLEKSVITQYTLHVDISKLEKYVYSVFVVNKQLDQRAKLIRFFREHPHVLFTAEYVGDPYIEFGIVVDNPYQLRQVLQEIQGTNLDSNISDVFMIQKEILPMTAARCVFDP